MDGKLTLQCRAQEDPTIYETLTFVYSSCRQKQACALRRSNKNLSSEPKVSVVAKVGIGWQRSVPQHCQ